MKKIKGFTLIECLVALAILGIAFLIMVEIYANVSRMNRNNHNNNTSLAYQMKYVEERTDSESIKIEYKEQSDKTSHRVNTSSNYATITKLNDDKTATTDVYYYGCDMYVLRTRDGNDQKIADSDEKAMNLRYKYMMGHTPS